MQIHTAFQANIQRMIAEFDGSSSGGMAFDNITRRLLIPPRGNLSALSALAAPRDVKDLQRA